MLIAACRCNTLSDNLRLRTPLGCSYINPDRRTRRVIPLGTTRYREKKRESDH